MSRRELELQVLSAAVPHIVGCAAAQTFAANAAAVLAELDPVSRRDAGKAIALFEGRIIGLLTTFRPARFTRSQPEQQRRRIEALGRSSFSLLRRLYRAIHRLCAAAHYLDPDEQLAIGYAGPPQFQNGRAVRS